MHPDLLVECWAVMISIHFGLKFFLYQAACPGPIPTRPLDTLLTARQLKLVTPLSPLQVTDAATWHCELQCLHFRGHFVHGLIPAGAEGEGLRNNYSSTEVAPWNMRPTFVFEGGIRYMGRHEQLPGGARKDSLSWPSTWNMHVTCHAAATPAPGCSLGPAAARTPCKIWPCNRRAEWFSGLVQGPLWPRPAQRYLPHAARHHALATVMPDSCGPCTWRSSCSAAPCCLDSWACSPWFCRSTAWSKSAMYGALAKCYLYLFKYVLFGSYLLCIPNTFWLKLDFLFGMLHFLFPSHPLPIGEFIILSCCFIVSCTPLEFPYCVFAVPFCRWGRSHLWSYCQATKYFVFFFWIILVFWYLIGSDVFNNTSTETNIVSGGIHAIRYELGYPIKNIGFSLLNRADWFSKFRRKSGRVRVTSVCHIRFASEL